LLRIIEGKQQPTTGSVEYNGMITFSSVSQIQDESSTLSGGQQFQKKLTQAIAKRPDVLLLDEPTNHLDQKNRAS